MEYKCGHRYSSKEKDYQASKTNFIEWKYSVGSNGNKKLCFDCWKEKQNQLQGEIK